MLTWNGTKPSFPILLIIVAVFLFLPIKNQALAVDAIVSWDPNTESDLAGYNVYQGENQGQYGPPQNCQLNTSHLISNLLSGKNYYFAVTAYDTAGNESEPSTEVTLYQPLPEVIADFESTITSGNAPLSVTFTDLSSGTPVSWLWDFGDGETSMAQHPSHTYNTAGAYTVRLTASNSAGSDTVTKANYLTVLEPPSNQAPTVEAGSDQSMTLPDVVTLDGTVTDDGLPNPPGVVTTAWSQVNGPGQATFADAAMMHTTVKFSTDGIYVLRLTATDGVLTNSDDITITVKSAPMEPTDVHVLDIVVTKESLKKGEKRGVAVVTIQDTIGNPVANAAVEGDFMEKASISHLAGFTDSKGQVTFFSNGVRGAGGKNLCFTVTNVDSTLPYKSSNNQMTQSCENGETF